MVAANDTLELKATEVLLRALACGVHRALCSVLGGPSRVALRNGHLERAWSEAHPTSSREMRHSGKGPYYRTEKANTPFSLSVPGLPDLSLNKRRGSVLPSWVYQVSRESLAPPQLCCLVSA